MKILYAASECAPFSKSGGLADVAYSLPPVLKAGGDDVEIITPLYKCVWDHYSSQLTFRGTYPVTLRDMQIDAQVYQGERDGVTVWFIGQEGLFMRDRLYGYNDDAWRFAFFSKAVIALLGLLSSCPDILHCNDWETAPASGIPILRISGLCLPSITSPIRASTPGKRCIPFSAWTIPGMTVR